MKIPAFWGQNVHLIVVFVKNYLLTIGALRMHFKSFFTSSIELQRGTYCGYATEPPKKVSATPYDV